MAKVVTITDKLDVLPLYDILSWERFQLFCTDVLYKRNKAIDSREYLLKGSIQDGIDVYVVNRGTEKLTVAQCKLRNYLGPQDIHEITKKFLNGALATDTGELIICTNVELKTQKDEQAIKATRQKLGALGIELRIWDSGGLSMELRTNPEPAYLEIVYHYFNEDICRLFFGDRWNADITRFRPVSKLIYTASPAHIPRNLTSFDERLKNPSTLGWNHWSDENAKTTLIDVVTAHKPGKPIRIVLLSTAGFGKSAELQELAAHFSAQDKKLYPVKYSLGSYESQDLEAILHQWNENWKNIPETDLLLILDGMDEITNQADLSFYKKINAFLEIHTGVHVVISSRSNFYELGHSPIKDFQVYLLDPLDRMDIENYLRMQLVKEIESFRDLIYRRGFSEYQENPYYLVRFVRFFKDKDKEFPRNKTELFERILFERMDKDETTFHAAGLRVKLYKVCSRIAFCMTLSGKSSLTDLELQTLVEDPGTRTELQRFDLLNRAIGISATWAFEHKNMQEYLCANALRHSGFSQLHPIISLRGEPNKLLPRFLNTVSFLFELVDKKEPVFAELFEWLSANEPELLVRFEKEQMAKPVRQEIFFRVFNAYEQKGLSLHSSANFSLQDLATFTGVDEVIVDFIGGKIKPSLPRGLLFDALNILSLCERAFLIKQKICNILFPILETGEFSLEVKASCIHSFYYLHFTDRQTFDRVFAAAGSEQHRDVQNAILTLLNITGFQEDYADYIIDNFRTEAQASNERHSRELVKTMVLKFTSPEKVKNLLRFCLLHPQVISAHHSYRSLQFTLEETKDILEKAVKIYKTDPSVLPLIYRLCCSLKFMSFYKDWNNIFIDFFERTCGKEHIFKKFYRHGRRPHDMLHFAEEKTCDFLINELKSGNVSVQEAIIIRNILSHINHPLFLYFYGGLKELPEADQFTGDEDNTDYNALHVLQEQKNQEMLLDKSLFLEEVAQVFKAIGKELITFHDLWFSESRALRRLETSLALESVRDFARDVCRDDEKQITKQEYFKRMNNQRSWNGFVIDSIKELLEKENPKINVRPELLQIITEWTIKEVKKLDVSKHVIIERPKGRYSYFPHTEYVKECVTLIKPELPDELLLKLLKTDYSSFYSLANPPQEQGKRQPLAGFVIERIKKQPLLRQEVITNIKNPAIPYRVRSTHFRICQLQQFDECLEELYHTITQDKRVDGYERIKLAEIYINLGGKWKDFSALLEIPASPNYEKSFVDWHWHLLDKLLYEEETKVTTILFRVLSEDTLDSNRLKASEMLIRLGNIKGLEYWISHVKTKKEMLFESRWETFYEFIRKMPFKNTVNIFIEALDSLYQHPPTNVADRFWRVDDSIFNSLINLAVQGEYQFAYIEKKVRKLIEKIPGEDQRYTIKHFIERIRHSYYQSINQQIDLSQAKDLYNTYLAVPVTSS